MLSSNCVVCSSIKSRFIKEQETIGLLSSLGIKTPLSIIPSVGHLLLMGYWQVNTRYEIAHNFLLAGDKVMPEMHLRQPGFTYSTCGLFTKSKEKTQKFKETGSSRYIHQNQEY